jgi:predicted short-subunit dehydrogenase-like oxidoreductase (DUF2520 family)
MRIVILGIGNVATVLGRMIREAEHEIVQVWGRSETGARNLADGLSAGYTTNLQSIDKGADLYLVAVSDSAIPAVADVLRLDRKLVVHTAGSVSKTVLKPCSSNYGVLYPLQSLRKEIPVLPVIPFLVDGNTGDDTALLMDFAKTLSADVQVAGDEDRLKLHVAAVIVSNFTNHLYVLAEDYCKEAGVNFKLLLPLINAIAGRLDQFSPSRLQTGPAIRNDGQTIESHLALLSDHPGLKEMYRLFTKSIQERHP